MSKRGGTARKSRDVRNILIDLIQSINAPLPIEYRMLPDGTIFNKNTRERIYQAEMNKRYLIAMLVSIEIETPKIPEVKAVNK